MELGRLFHELAIDRVFHPAFYRHSDGLGHLVAGNHTNPDLS
jgi:hypothetical protein